MGRVWFRARSACPPPFPVPVCGVGVRAGPGSRLCPALLGWVVGGCFLRFFFLAFWCRLLGVPVPGLVVPVPPSPSFRGGLLAFFFFRGVCLHVSVSLFPVGGRSWLGVAGLGWVVPLCLFGGPVFGAFWVGGLAASGGVGGRFGGCGLFLHPPPSTLCFFLGAGGLPVPPTAFPRLAHALARIQCGLPGCCWRLHSVWPCSGPMGRVGYVHVGLGALLARLGRGSAGWAAAPGGCVGLWVRGLGLFVSFPLCGASFNLPGGLPPLLPGAWSPRLWPAVPVCGVLVRRLPGCAVACFG